MTKSLSNSRSRHGDASAEEKQKQQVLFGSQLAMLQAQLAQLQRQQAEEAMPNRKRSGSCKWRQISPPRQYWIDIYI
ncbi:FlxA-like family protein [Shigella flexneri]